MDLSIDEKKFPTIAYLLVEDFVTSILILFSNILKVEQNLTNFNLQLNVVASTAVYSHLSHDEL